jgi:SAM-dependent methyltransferase
MNTPMNSSSDVNLWPSAEHALDYLRRAGSIPHRVEGEAALLEFVPVDACRILDLGCGGGRLLALVKSALPRAQFVGLDFSPTMLDTVRKRYAGDTSVGIVEHDLENPLPPLGKFDVVVSSFAIHHLSHERKHALYAEIFEVLAPNGLFCNLEHVSSPTPRLYEKFLQAISQGNEDPSNKLLDLETQLRWMRQIGYVDVDCHWKWRELALMVGAKPGGNERPQAKSPTLVDVGGIPFDTEYKRLSMATAVRNRAGKLSGQPLNGELCAHANWFVNAYAHAPAGLIFELRGRDAWRSGFVFP